ncbi:hypothetical protein EDB84DRAFT_1491197 [Lactarius hengduanensis]|nr:hypothetical protein EDB84DRAFT_1491197 [Lactarius hengduanensis]
MFVVCAAATGGGGGDGDGKGRDARWIRPIRAHVTRPGLRMGLRMGLGLAHLDPSRSSPRSPASLPAPSHHSPREILHESEGREEIHGPRRSHAPFPSFLGRRFEDACYWTYVDRYQQHVFTSPSSHHRTDVVALRLSFSFPSSMFTPLPTATLVLARRPLRSSRVPLPALFRHRLVVPGYLDLSQTRVLRVLSRPPVVGVQPLPPPPSCAGREPQTSAIPLAATGRPLCVQAQVTPRAPSTFNVTTDPARIGAHLAHFASLATHNADGITPAWTASSRSTRAERDVQDGPPQWVVLRRR